MSSQSDGPKTEDPPEHPDPDKAAAAKDLAAQVKQIALDLHTENSIYAYYALLDSTSAGISTANYVSNMLDANSNDLHDFMMTPEGAIAIAAETLFLITFSYFAYEFDKDKNDKLKQAFALAWLYTRDILKALKYAYKAWRTLIGTLLLLGDIDLNYLLIPVSLILGGLAVIIRVTLRYILESRKAMMLANAAFVEKMRKIHGLDEEQRQDAIKEIQEQTLTWKAIGYAAVTAGGIIDGMYLFAGVLLLTPFSSNLFVVMSALCAFYVIACVITRIYEEYIFQLRLIATQTQAHLVLIGKRMECVYEQLENWEECRAISKEQEVSYLKNKLSNLIEELKVQRTLLKEQTSRSYFSAILYGMKNSIYAYNAMSSLMFFLGGCFLIAGVTFPPALILANVILGLVVMATFITLSVIENYNFLQAQEKENQESYLKLCDMQDALNKGEHIDFNNLTEFLKQVNESIDIKPAPTNLYPEWAEVLRSLFSGLGKGFKFMSFIGVVFQQMDENGNYQDASFITVLGAAAAVFFGGVFTSRALAKGYRPPLGIKDMTLSPPQPELSESSEGENEEFSGVDEEETKDQVEELPYGPKEVEEPASSPGGAIGGRQRPHVTLPLTSPSRVAGSLLHHSPPPQLLSAKQPSPHRQGMPRAHSENDLASMSDLELPPSAAFG